MSFLSNYLLLPSSVRIRTSRASSAVPGGGNALVLLFVVVSGLLLLLTALQTRGGVAEAACPPQGCGRFGSCRKDTRACGDNCQEVCKCLPNFYGSDCSFQAEVCPSGNGSTSGSGSTTTTTTSEQQVCYNGGTCYKVHSSTPGQGSVVTWRCDCRHSYGEAAIYAGKQCEYPSEISCEIDNPSSIYAFCVNNGKCISMINSGEPHPGCYCQAGFEGQHCQYAVGTAPGEEPPLVNTSVSTQAPSLVNTSVSTQAPLVNTSVSTQTPLVNTSVSTQAPLVNTSVSTQAPLVNTSVSTQAPLVNKSVSMQAPLVHTSVSTQAGLGGMTGFLLYTTVFLLVLLE